MKYLVICLCIVAFVSCITNTVNEKETVQYFKEHIAASMNYSELVEIFGEPDKDIGSGIHIYVYQLKDNTGIWIGYTDTILYVKHMSKEGKMLSSILN